MEIILYAFLLGVALSLVLIGPAFFLLIETSLTKGWRAAITLDAGVIAADLLCIVIAYFGSKDLVVYIQTHKSLYIIGGFIVMIYGTIMFFSKPVLHINNSAVVGPNYFKTFLNGFMMNLLNIGIVIFWFVVVGWVTINFPKTVDFIIFMGVVFATFLGIDFAKIFLAQRFQERMNDQLVYKIRKVLGVLLVIFGLTILLKGFFTFDSMERVLPELPLDVPQLNH